jgi:excisionase family DNA binding protein
MSEKPGGRPRAFLLGDAILTLISVVTDISLENAREQVINANRNSPQGLRGGDMQHANGADLTRRLPTREEVASAAEAATTFALAARDGGAVVIHDQSGRPVQLAPAVSDLVIDILSHIARGDMVTLVPIGAMLTTQQAADILNVSRPYLSGLLKDGTIPFIPIGSHRRVRFDDLMAFKARRDAGRLKALKDLARLGQEFDAR